VSLGLGSALSLLVEVAVPIILLVKVGDLDPIDLPSLLVPWVVLDDRVHILKDCPRLTVLGDIPSIGLKLRHDRLSNSVVDSLLEVRIVKQDPQGGSRLAIDLSDDVGDHNAIPLPRLVNQLEVEPVLANLDGPRLNLAALLSVSVVGELPGLEEGRGPKEASSLSTL
jgi:hypothetical protein